MQEPRVASRAVRCFALGSCSRRSTGRLTMFIGHYAPAFVAATSRKSPRRGALFVAAQLVDIAFFTFLILGVEHLRMMPHATAMNGMDLYDMPWTHSLAGAIGWGVLFAVAIKLLR